MTIEQGIVKEVRGNKVLIETEPDSGCGSCPMSKKCVVVEHESKRNLWALHTMDLAAGDRVEFSIDGVNLLYTSVLIYLVPAVLLLIGAVLGENMTSLWGLDKDLRAFVLGLLFFLGSWIIVRVVSYKMERNNRSMPAVTRKLPPTSE